MNSDFGSTLRNARMRQGYDINTVARRLRIRPDVIQAIEDSDFSRMPPRGYARNMINSYAHLLGLNSSQMTRQYLDELYAYQVNAARQNSRGHGFDLPENRRYGDFGMGAKRDREPQRGVRTRTEGSERFGQRVYDDGYDHNASQGTGMSGRRGARGFHSRGASSAGFGGDEYLNVYKGPSASQSWTANWRQRLPLIGVVAAVVILIIILLVLVFGPKSSGGDEVTNMPVTGVESAGTSVSADAAPTSFEFSYEVAKGKSAWIECYVDGDTKLAKTVDGPASETFTVTKKVEFMAGTTDGVTVKQAGKEVELKANSAGSVDVTLKFSDYLKQWKKDNGVTSSSSKSESGSSSTDSSESSSEATEESSSSSQE